MRMWLVNPKLLCNQHLLGEHVELHMLVGTLRKKISVKGYLEKGLIEVDKIHQRHRILIEEMTGRGFNHRSSLPSFTYSGPFGVVDRKRNIQELSRRCQQCFKRIKEIKNVRSH